MQHFWQETPVCQGFLPYSPLLLVSFLNLITRKSITFFNFRCIAWRKVLTTKTLLKLLQIFDIKSLCKDGGSRWLQTPYLPPAVSSMLKIMREKTGMTFAIYILCNDRLLKHLGLQNPIYSTTFSHKVKGRMVTSNELEETITSLSPICRLQVFSRECDDPSSAPMNISNKTQFPSFKVPCQEKITQLLE